MKTLTIQGLGTEELVNLFAKIAIQQDDALLGNEIGRFNRLFDQMAAVKNELKARPGDQRRLLCSLYDHPNAQVRLKAAVATLAVEPIAARSVLEAIASSRKFPQAGDAGMTLDGLDNGEFVPT